MERKFNIDKFFGENSLLLKQAQRLSDSIPPTDYTFMNHEKFGELLSSSVSEGMFVYWKELLLRAHMASCCGLRRLLAWYDGLYASSDNFLMFCASFRGLLEATGDTYHGLSTIALSLAQQHRAVETALSKKMAAVTLFQELEDRLVHFTHASKGFFTQTQKSEVKPLPSADYVKILENGSKIQFYALYSFLCEVVHPASASLGYMFDEAEGTLRYVGNRDSIAIEALVARESDTISELVARGFNPIFTLMKTVDRFQVAGYTFDEMRSVSLRNIPIWGKIESEFQK